MQDSESHNHRPLAHGPSPEDPWVHWLQHEPGEAVAPEFQGVRGRVGSWVMICALGFGFWAVLAVAAGSLLA